MKLLILNEDDVAKLLPMDVCIDLVADGLKALSGDEAVNPLRQIMWLPDKRGLLGMMPAFMGGDAEKLGVKVLSIFPGNHGGDIDSHQGAMLLFDAKNGILKAVMNAGALTAVRTAAASGVATRLLACTDAEDLTLLGSGVQAHSHLAAMRAVRDIKRVRIWSRTLAHAQRFAEMYDGIEVVGTVQEAVNGADIVCTLTAAPDPIVKFEWLSNGVHINAVGSSTPHARELDTETVVQSQLYVDRRESTLNEAGDFLIPKNEGAIEEDHIVGELGDMMLGHIQGRQSGDDITLFKSLGVGIEDVVSADYVYENALKKEIGTWVTL